MLYEEGGSKTGQTQLLTANGTVLLFTTELRLHRYIQVAGVSFEGYAVQPVLAVECARLLRTLSEQGINSLALDRCPGCLVAVTVPLSEVASTEDLLTLWSVTRATQAELADIFYRHALELLMEGEFGEAALTLAAAANSLDPADARVHFLRGYCGLVLDDTPLVDDALGMLSVVAPSAQERLQALADGEEERPNLHDVLEYVETLDRGE
jgi:hypothetical protein